AGNDSGTNASAYATYSNDSSINITITTSNSNPNFQVGYYASINPNDDTKSLVKEALEYYIEQPYCPVVGKIWIISVLEQMK
ncbi:MAG: hypothetical protein LBT17_00105, partial [Mycoplasmataceae bacterium]|nr:hypothetical protein [Mycoplasmataceae bacterium]